MSRRIMGIDLGTTNTCVAVFSDGRPLVVPNAEGMNTTPSVVAFSDRGEMLVGSAARRQAVVNPKRTIHSVKRLMGQQPDSDIVKRLDTWLGYDIGADERGQLVIRVGARDRTPVEISAIILKAVRSSADEYFGEPCTDAVITCPAWFDDTQRTATVDAARIAGINVLRLLNEPTAAALAYGFAHKKTGRFVVFDWGGGTFDCSVLESGDGIVQVKATRGDAFLGGNDLDEKLMGVLTDHFYRVHGVELQSDATALQRLRDAAEAAKIELSSAQESEIILPFLYNDAQGPKHLEMTLTRSRFEQLIEDSVRRTLDCCRQALDDAGVARSDVDDVLLVGGSTKIPLVQHLLTDFFGKPPRRGVSADEAVALGAAIHAASMEGDIDDVLLLDVLPLSLGVAEGERFSAMLHRNVTIPTYRTDTFSTSRDFQSSVLIRVYQGDHPLVKDNRLVGSFRLNNLPPRRAGDLKLDVSFTVDQNGILMVEAKEAKTGMKHSIQVRDTMRLSDAEVERLSRRMEEA